MRFVNTPKFSKQKTVQLNTFEETTFKPKLVQPKKHNLEPSETSETTLKIAEKVTQTRTDQNEPAPTLAKEVDEDIPFVVTDSLGLNEQKTKEYEAIALKAEKNGGRALTFTSLIPLIWLIGLLLALVYWDQIVLSITAIVTLVLVVFVIIFAIKSLSASHNTSKGRRRAFAALFICFPIILLSFVLLRFGL